MGIGVRSLQTSDSPTSGDVGLRYVHLNDYIANQGAAGMQTPRKIFQNSSGVHVQVLSYRLQADECVNVSLSPPQKRPGKKPGRFYY